MSRSSSKTRRAARAAGVTARSAQSSGIVKCYVERFENAVGAPDLRLREKSTKRLVRVLTDNQMFRSFAPLSNLLQDCYAHGGGLVCQGTLGSPCGRSVHLPARGQLISLCAVS